MSINHQFKKIHSKSENKEVTQLSSKKGVADYRSSSKTLNFYLPTGTSSNIAAEKLASNCAIVRRANRKGIMSTTSRISLAQSACFVPSTIWTSQFIGKPTRASSRLHAQRDIQHCYRKGTTRASIPNQNEGDAKEKVKKKTKTEEIAEKMGQSRETMEIAREKVFTEERLSNRKKYGLVFTATIAAVLIFLLEKSNPSGGVNLLRFLQKNSAPVEVVGNGRPTVIEFSAVWCESCKQMAHNVFDLENEYVNRVNFVVLNAGDPENAAFMDSFGVDGIPQFSLMATNGQNLGNLIGYTPKFVLNENIDAMLNGQEILPHPGFSLLELSQMAK